METVTIRLQDQYAMPSVCCACGAPAGAGRLVKSGSSWSQGKVLNLSFPLCDRCALLSKTLNRRRRVSCLAGLALSLLLCTATFAISWAFEPGDQLDAVLGSLIVLTPLALVGTLIAQWLVTVVGVDRAAGRTYRRVLRAVKVRRYDPDMFGGGYITLTFANDHFADLFREMNVGVVMPGGVG